MTVEKFKLPAVMFVVVWALLLLAPLVPLMPALRAAKRVALPSYAAIVAEQGRQVRRRWIDGTTKIDGSLLEPAGIGVTADAANLFNAVRSMRTLPLGRTTVVDILAPIAVPMLIVAALQIPLKTLLLSLVKALMG